MFRLWTKLKAGTLFLLSQRTSILPLPPQLTRLRVLATRHSYLSLDLQDVHPNPWDTHFRQVGHNDIHFIFILYYIQNSTMSRKQKQLGA